MHRLYEGLQWWRIALFEQDVKFMFLSFVLYLLVLLCMNQGAWKLQWKQSKSESGITFIIRFTFINPFRILELFIEFILSSAPPELGWRAAMLSHTIRVSSHMVEMLIHTLWKFSAQKLTYGADFRICNMSISVFTTFSVAGVKSVAENSTACGPTLRVCSDDGFSNAKNSSLNTCRGCAKISGRLRRCFRRGLAPFQWG